jgi:hypothetical protein
VPSYGDERLYVRAGGAVATSEIAGVVALGTALIGDRHPTVERLGARIEADPDCLLVVSRPDAAGHGILAYSIVYALAPPTTQGALARSLSGGAELRPSDLDQVDATSLYVGMVAAADGPGNRVLALRAVATHVTRRLAALPDASWLFARAATTRGHRLLRSCGFSPLEAPSPLWARRVDADLALAGGHDDLLGRSEVAAAANRMRAT